MHKTILTTLLFFTLSLALQAQDCTQDSKAQRAKNNMGADDAGLTCGNVAQFYAKLCQCESVPLPAEQALNLKKQLQALKKSYNDFGVYCEGFGELTDDIPDCLVKQNGAQNANDQKDLKEFENALQNFLGGANTGNGTSGGGGCNFAARDKFGDRSFSGAGVEHAANQYEGYRCHCINGTLQDGFTDPSFDPKPLDTKKALEQIKGLRQNYYRMKGPGDPALSPLPSKCSDNPGDGNTGGGPKPIFEQSFDEILAGEELSNGLTSFANDLAAISQNPKIKRLSNDMNAVQSKYDNIESNVQSVANMFGGSIDQETQSMMNAYQNIEMAVAIGKAIFGKEPSLEESLSESQQAVRSHMLDISKNLRTMYDEVVAVEPYLNQSENYLTILDNKLQQIEDYNAVTSRERYFYLWYLDFDGYPNLQDYNAELDRVQQYTVAQLLEKTGQLQQKFDMSNKPHIANKEVAFAGAKNQILFNKMRYYKEHGQEAKAEELKASLSFDIPIGQAVELVLESFKQKEYYATTRYAQIVQDYFYNEKLMHLYYKDIPGLPRKYGWDSDDGINRGDVSILMMLGIVAAAESEQLSQAQHGLAVLTEFHNNTLGWRNEDSRGNKRKRASQDAVKNLLAMHLTQSNLALNTAKTYVNLGLGNYSSALVNIDSAKQNLSITTNTVPENLFHKLKIMAYLGLKDYGKAKEVFRQWNNINANSSSLYGSNSYTMGIEYVSPTDKDFYNALIRYQKKDYKGALLALKLLKMKIDAPESRIFLLEENVHQALGNTEEAKKAHNNYINLLNK